MILNKSARGGSTTLQPDSQNGVGQQPKIMNDQVNGVHDTSNGTSKAMPAWKSKAYAHRQRKLNLIPAEWRLQDSQIPSTSEARNVIPVVEQHLTREELEITRSNAVDILANIHGRRWTSRTVTSALCHRAALLHQLTKCLTEILFEEGLARAAELDEHLERTGEVVGPLHGLPLSIKDNHDMKGVDTTLGWVGLIDKPAKADAPAVELYRKLGVVLYVKTNIPQSLMMSDSYNHVFGQSVNSLNRDLISGGSSGGEGALVAAGGSVIGVGTDIGGSVRIPASLQGLYGLSPTIGRVGNRESEKKGTKYVVPPVAGPMTRDLESLELFMKALAEGKGWEDDPGLLPIPWREDEIRAIQEKPKLKVAYVLDDGIVKCQPAVERAVRETVDKLQAAGHEVFEWQYANKSHREGYDLWLKAVMADGGKRFEAFRQLEDEPLIKGMLVGKAENELDIDARQTLSDQIFDYQKAYMKKWKDEGVDALIMPVTQYVGLRPKTWVKSDMYCGYTAIVNLLNWTSLTVPAVTLNKDLDKPSAEWQAHKGRSFHDQFIHDIYDVELCEGMPIGVQIITGRFGEERAVGIARLLKESGK